MVNPRARKGRSLKTWQRIEAVLQAARQKYHVYYTRCRGESGAIAERVRAAGAELVVGVGGDGTLLEVVNGLDLKKNIFGIIPTGTGNGFRRSLGLPGDVYKALIGMSLWEPRLIDLGTVNGLIFLNVVGFGFDAAVAKQATVDNRLLWGYPAYVSAFLAKLATFHSFPVSASFGGHTVEERQALLGIVANGSYYGGRLCIAPQARVDDGLLDLCLVRKTGAVDISALAVKAFFKTHLSHDAVYTQPCASVTITAEGDVPVHIDGEILGTLPAKIEVLPRALWVLAPPEGP